MDGIFNSLRVEAYEELELTSLFLDRPFIGEYRAPKQVEFEE